MGQQRPNDLGVPDVVKVGRLLAVAEPHAQIVAAAVPAVTGMEGLVDVSDQVNDPPQGCEAARTSRLGAEVGDGLLEGGDDAARAAVAGRIVAGGEGNVDVVPGSGRVVPVGVGPGGDVRVAEVAVPDEALDEAVSSRRQPGLGDGAHELVAGGAPGLRCGREGDEAEGG